VPRISGNPKGNTSEMPLSPDFFLSFFPSFLLSFFQEKRPPARLASLLNTHNVQGKRLIRQTCARAETVLGNGESVIYLPSVPRQVGNYP
jgi:hypothetical protein